MVALEFVIIEVETLNPHSLWIYHEWQQNQIKWTFHVTIFITMLRTSIIPPTIAPRKFLVSSFGEGNLETAECVEWFFLQISNFGNIFKWSLIGIQVILLYLRWFVNNGHSNKNDEQDLLTKFWSPSEQNHNRLNFFPLFTGNSSEINLPFNMTTKMTIWHPNFK